jgi:hypothetical protein
MAEPLRDRRKSFEEKFRLDQELQFRVVNRRNKLLGLWLGERFGLTGADRDAYAGTIVAADFAKPGDDDVIAKVIADVAARGMRLTEAEIRAKLGEFAIIAKSQIEAEAAS